MAFCETDICVPDLCTYFDPPEPGTCCAIKNKIITGNTFYVVSDIIYQESKKIFGDVPSTIQTSVKDWYIQNVIAYYAPFVLIILVVFIIFMLNGFISLAAGILLILIFLIMVFASVYYIYYNTVNLTNDLPIALQEQVLYNYEQQLPTITCAIEKALFFPEGITCLTDGDPPEPCELPQCSQYCIEQS